jgi:hypothetical protein
MVALTALWLPILLSAVLVFVVSSAIHMMATWHRNDLKRLPGQGEEAVRQAIRETGAWAVAFRHAVDGLVYGLCTAGIFAWLWP